MLSLQALGGWSLYKWDLTIQHHRPPQRTPRRLLTDQQSDIRPHWGIYVSMCVVTRWSRLFLKWRYEAQISTSIKLKAITSFLTFLAWCKSTIRLSESGLMCHKTQKLASIAILMHFLADYVTADLGWPQGAGARGHPLDTPLADTSLSKQTPHRKVLYVFILHLSNRLREKNEISAHHVSSLTRLLKLICDFN